jgi:predicted metalloendopeptidase
MERGDPRRDFGRYVTGHRLDAAKGPGNTVRTSRLDALSKSVGRQQPALHGEVCKASGTAPKGTPLQLVGDFYASAMDVQRLTELGWVRLQPELDRNPKIGDAMATIRGHVARWCIDSLDESDSAQSLRETVNVYRESWAVGLRLQY